MTWFGLGLETVSAIQILKKSNPARRPLRGPARQNVVGTPTIWHEKDPRPLQQPSGKKGADGFPSYLVLSPIERAWICAELIVGNKTGTAITPQPSLAAEDARN